MVQKRIDLTLSKLRTRLHGLGFPHMRRVAQITVYHCGPAVVVMLLSLFGIKVSQRAVAKAGRAEKRLKKYGMNIKEIGRAVSRLSRKNLIVWYKLGTSPAELAKLVNNYRVPVGVEWQGIFYEDEDDDNGHYSVVTVYDRKNGLVALANPYPIFSGMDHYLKIRDFTKRWWDENDIYDKTKHKYKKVTDRRLMFIVVKASDRFPKTLGMRTNIH